MLAYGLVKADIVNVLAYGLVKADVVNVCEEITFKARPH